jgi:hypothetical protein
MPKLPSLLFLLATLVAPSSRNPGNPAAEAFRKVAGGHSKTMLAAARLMPADKYGYRPTPAQRSLGETIAREANSQRAMTSARSRDAVPHDFLMMRDAARARARHTPSRSPARASLVERCRPRSPRARMCLDAMA